MQNIKNIIFDLGGVILNIDFKKTEEAFSLLGLDNFSNHINQFHITDFFLLYETGKINDDEFVAGIMKLIKNPVEPHQVIHAWNALILDFPPERIELLRGLKKKFRLYLLSNTNAIHVKEFTQRFNKEYGFGFESLFEKIYYSNVVKLRKPDVAIFEMVLNENNLIAEETLFVDDTASNFPEAEKLGVKTYHVKPGVAITDMELFKL